MKRLIIITIILTLLASIGIFSLLGSRVDIDQLIVNECQQIVKQVSSNNVEFVERVPLNSKVHSGEYIFTDNTYKYYYNYEKKYVTTIIISSEKQSVLSSNNLISENSARESAEAVFKNYMSSYLAYNYKTTCINKADIEEGTYYIFEISEMINGIETGTKSSIVLNFDGTLISATNLLGNLEKISSLNVSKLISEEDANYIALKTLRETEIGQIGLDGEKIIMLDLDLNSTNEFASYTCSIKTFNEQIYWLLELPIKHETVKSSYITSYLISIDAVDGHVIEIAKAAGYKIVE